MTETIAIGEEIKRAFDESHIKMKAFAREIHTAERNVYNIFGRENLDTNQLYAISKALKKDFFKLYSKLLASGGYVAEEPGEKYETGAGKTKKVLIEIEISDQEYNDLISKRR